MQQGGIMNYYQNYLIEKIMKDDTTTIDVSGYGGAGQPSYTLNTGGGAGAVGSNGLTGGYGVDTITLDPSIYSSGTSITVPSSVTWSQGYSANSTWTNTTANVNIDTDGISIKEGGDIKIAGKSLSDAIEKIEARLGILNPNPELEDRWDQLKVLRKQYMDLEKDLLEKEKLMKILKEQ
jgi:hypothetical protein